MPDLWLEAIRVDELKPGQKRKLLLNGCPILVVNLEGQFYALDATCLHQGAPLCEGMLSGEFIVCPSHHWMTNVKTGKVAYPPIDGQVATYPVRLTENYVEVGFPAGMERFIAPEDAARYGARGR